MSDTLQLVLALVPTLIVAIMIHEVAQGCAASISARLWRADPARPIYRR